MDGGAHTTNPDGTDRFVPWAEEPEFRRCAKLWYDDGIWAQRFATDFQFEIGRRYLSLEGKIVTIVDRSDVKHYECVKGDDGIWRYNRTDWPGNIPEGLGRTTGSSWDRLTNLIPVALVDDVEPQTEETP